MTGEPSNEAPGENRRRRPYLGEATAPKAFERTLSFARRAVLLGLVCASVLIGTPTFATAASGTTAASKVSAGLTTTSFAISQARLVKLTYRFSKPSKSFSYRLVLKKGNTQLLVKSVKRKGSFSGRKTMTVFKLFTGRMIKVGYYRLELSSDSAHKRLNFKIVPFSGRLTKKSFATSEARLVKLIYAFSKPSKSFSYRLSLKKGSKWQVVRSAKKITKTKKTYFKGQKKATVKSLFGKKPIKVGSYRLKISCAYSSRLLTFKVVKGPKGGGSGGNGSASGNGEGNATAAIAGFGIAGSVSGLELGLTRPIKLTLTNPNGVPIHVTELTVTVSADSTPSGCSSATNLRITQSDVSDSSPITIPANGGVTIEDAPRAPRIILLNLPDVNQNACRNVSFALTFSGSAHS